MFLVFFLHSEPDKISYLRRLSSHPLPTFLFIPNNSFSLNTQNTLTHTLFQFFTHSLFFKPLQTIHKSIKMKSFAVIATLASMVAANPGLVDSLLSGTANIKLPAGIEITADLGPKQAPKQDETNMWHPHHDVPMDGCDSDADGWHYVHPCDACDHGHHTWTTSTATNVVTKTVIDCAPTVTDCPARTTAVTTVTTTICPVTNTATATTEVPATTVVPVVTETPCPETTVVPVPPVWTTSPCPETTKAPMPPATVVPPRTNNTWTQPPVIVNGGAQAQVGIFAAVAAIAALL